ncbi:MAG: peptide ABC transporter ATP-binding protein [Bdellovibrionales bacterium GWA2_49_15]|nr:MAG: peptide ABC transporter ATP-binding protein [Bdellovibrionales bacterium GWA2_49_15]
MLLDVQNLTITFNTKNGLLTAVRDLSFQMETGETLGVVGESGCGKSITNLAIMGLLPSQAIVSATRLSLEGKDLLSLSEREWQRLRGKDIAMIFQDPMSALNPCYSVGDQLVETLLVHRDMSKKDARLESLNLMEQVGIPAPGERLKAYPHELSGGMAQRVMIAMAISSNPKLLIADEPTTALDVTIQDQILRLLKDIQEKRQMSLMLVTHDLGVVAQNTDRIQVMYAGELVEAGLTRDVIHHSTHPYTAGLLAGHPDARQSADKTHKARLPSIQGMVPNLRQRPQGCQFHPRCAYAQDKCRLEAPKLTGQVSCHYPLPGSSKIC